MDYMTAGHMAEACGGEILFGDPETPVDHISLDSRHMKGNDLFVPLIGEKVDAHKFIPQAMDNGAAAVLTSEHREGAQCIPRSGVWIKVEDTKKALQAIGCECRRRLDLPVIGITGSVGKTTTREMVAAALSAKYRVFKTPGNYNSQVGVPVTISEMKKQDEMAVIELGMSEPGEMTIIARIAQVDMAVITNIGVTHIGQLKSQENIYKEKMCIQDGMKEGGTLILNGDDPWLKNSRAKEGCRTVYYGTGEQCSYRAVDIQVRDGYPSFTAVCCGQRVPVQLGVMGIHQVGNALAALAAADLYGVPLPDAAKVLGQFKGYTGRQERCEKDGILFIDDTYNASPASMKVALDILSSLEHCRRRIAVLADMKELGEDALSYHREVGEHAGQGKTDVLFTLGELAKEIQRGALSCRPDLTALHFEEKEELKKYLSGYLEKGDAVLFKGSNTMKLGEVAQHVCQHHH